MGSSSEKILISCPKCDTRYRFPKQNIGSKPMRMRCPKCKNTFTVARRDSIPPQGLQRFEYEDFSRESSHLPSEFGFLSKIPTGATQALPSEEAEVVQATRPATAPPHKEEKAPIPTSVDEQSEPVPPPPPQASAQAVPSADVHFDENDTSWSSADPFDLGDYSMGEESAQSKIIGKVVTTALVLVVLFMLFVAYRNGWSISAPTLGSQIAFAFSGKEYEALPDEVKDLEATVEARDTVTAGDGRTLLLVSGRVHNNGPIARTHVVLRGRLMSAESEVRAEAKAPCGFTIESKDLKAATKGTISSLYRTGGKPVNCSIKGDSSGAYQLVFDDPPPDHASFPTLEVMPVSARYPQ
ncbi:MAG: hypothetical protein GY854_22040 [Deltaproteobacteria bacterium]|nr:hypothetical protein [Deltaproteobacteria bacterium]